MCTYTPEMHTKENGWLQYEEFLKGNCLILIYQQSSPQKWYGEMDRKWREGDSQVKSIYTSPYSPI